MKLSGWLLALTFFTACPSPGQAAELYLFSDIKMSSETLEKGLSKPFVDGMVYVLTWADAEQEEGKFNWTDLDAAFDTAIKNGKKINLRLYPTHLELVPGWVIAKGTKTYLAPAIEKNGQKINDALPWDRVMIAEWTEFLAQLSEHLQSKKYMDHLAYIGEGEGSNQVHFAVRGCSSGYMDTIKFDWDAYMDASVNKTRTLLTHFPGATVQVMAPPENMCAGDNRASEFFNSFMGKMGKDAKRLMIVGPDLTAKGSERLDNLGLSIGENRMGTKFIWSKIADGKKFFNGTMEEAVCQALTRYRAEYIEAFLLDISFGRYGKGAEIQDALMAAHNGSTGMCNISMPDAKQLPGQGK